MTAVVLILTGEISTRLIYKQKELVSCEYMTPAGLRFHPNCTAKTKVWEGPWITQHFNDCGYRTPESCAPRPSGSLRVAVIGSSIARAAFVGYNESFAGRASKVLSDKCGASVDFQNLGTESTDMDRLDRRMQEVLALKPAAIVMTIGPSDLIHLKDPPPTTRDQVQPLRFDFRTAVTLLRESRLFVLMEYYLYSDPSFQVRAFLLNGDSSDYVRAPLRPAWQKRVADVGDLLGRITAQTQRDLVPVLLFYVPSRAQAALASQSSDPPGIDPFVVGRALHDAAAQHGVQFFDATKAFAHAPDFQSLFYRADGHPQDGGHAALAGIVEKALMAEPAFSACQRVAGK